MKKKELTDSHSPGITKKWRRIMRITIVLIVGLVFSANANSYSQGSKIDIRMTDRSIRDVIAYVEDHSEFVFLYKNEDFNIEKKVSLNFKDAGIHQILDKVFEGEGVVYDVYDRQIIIRKAENQLSYFQQAQQKTITGVVTDQKGLPLPGVSVVVKGTTIGTVTNPDGGFTLAVPSNAETLQFSFVGMKAQEVAMEGRTAFTVVMEEEAFGLEEVVAIGYGVQKKVNVIGSISTVSNEELTSSPVARVSNALAGRLSGTIVQQSSGEPGNDAASILLRGRSTLGNNTPLIVVDGIPDRDLNSIESEDIESLTVLKDAAAAIYGARSANGVILVTTKRGKEGTPVYKYGYYRGWSSPTKITEVVDAPTYAKMIREQESYQGVPEDKMMFSLEDIEKYKSGEYPWTHPNTNWYDAAISNSAKIDHHVFSVSGGTKKMSYYGSFGKQSDDGIYKANATSYDRYNIRINLDVELNDYLDVGLSVNGSQENKMYPTKSANSIFQNGIYRSKPTETAIYPNGLPGQDVEYGDQPVVSTSFETGFDDTKIYRSQNILSANLKIPSVDGLSLAGYFSYDLYFNTRKLFQKPWTLYVLDEDAYFTAGNTGKEDGSDFLKPYTTGYPEPRLTDSYTDSRTLTYNFKVNYDKTINNSHNLNAFIAYESLDYKDKGISAYRRYFISDQLPYLFAGGTQDQNIGSSVSIDARMNYFGRLSYNYSEKYLLQFSFRRDGSLRFSKEHGRWGNFPSLLVGWRASSEEFWKERFAFIDYFKLKASYGKLGNDAVKAFQYLTNYRFSTGSVFGSNKAYLAGLTQDGVPNPFITWEVANIVNVGFESLFLNEKFKFDFEYFHERRNNILVQRNASVPDFTGLQLPDENFGIVDNSGIELNYGYNTNFEGFYFSLNGNFSFTRNKIVEFDEPERNVSWQRLTGHPMGAALLYKSIGIFKDESDISSYPHVSGAIPGDIKILDYNDDGKITNDDRIIFDKTAIPEIAYGFNFSVKYKNWSLNTLFQGVGNTMKQIYTAVQGKGGTYYQYDAEGRWTKDNISASKPRAFERDDPYWRGSHMTDYYFHNMSYLRLKNVELSYFVPKNIVKSIWLKNAEVYFSGQNLLLLYAGEGSKIMDPELSSVSNYPIMKVVSLGFKLSF